VTLLGPEVLLQDGAFVWSGFRPLRGVADGPGKIAKELTRNKDTPWGGAGSHNRYF
jgi:hypothetical protein